MPEENQESRLTDRSNLRPPFLFGQRVRYGWLWSHSGSRIELTRLLVEWVLVVVTGAVGVLFLSDSDNFAPVRGFRRWWTSRRLVVSGSAADDATVRLVTSETEQGVRWFFVKAHEGTTVGGIEPGQYELRFTTGLDWDVDDEVFRWGAAYSEFDRKLTYVETHDAEGIDYHKMSVTLRGHLRTRTP